MCAMDSDRGCASVLAELNSAGWPDASWQSRSWANRRTCLDACRLPVQGSERTLVLKIDPSNCSEAGNWFSSHLGKRTPIRRARGDKPGEQAMSDASPALGQQHGSALPAHNWSVTAYTRPRLRGTCSTRHAQCCPAVNDRLKEPACPQVRATEFTGKLMTIRWRGVPPPQAWT
jgi:hypothetical protein